MEHAQALLRDYAQNRRRYDALFLDMEMGGMNGIVTDNAIEACERLETADKRIILDLRQEDNTLFCQLANTASSSAAGQ